MILAIYINFPLIIGCMVRIISDLTIEFGMLLVLFPLSEARNMLFNNIYIFNIYINVLPQTSSWKLGYVDDWEHPNSFEGLETILTQGMNKLADYFSKWYLQMNTNKTVSTIFHLNNRNSNDTVQVYSNNAS